MPQRWFIRNTSIDLLTGRQPHSSRCKNSVGHVTEITGHVPEFGGHAAETVGHDDPKYAAMHIDLQTLAEQAHVHRNTISRAPSSRGVQEFLREALRVIKAATDLNGDLNKALFWYRTEPLGVFGYKTAERLGSEGRTDDLLRYVTSLEAGATG